MFRVLSDATREASLRPAHAGVIVFNLIARRIVQVQNAYVDIGDISGARSSLSRSGWSISPRGHSRVGSGRLPGRRTQPSDQSEWVFKQRRGQLVLSHSGPQRHLPLELGGQQVPGLVSVTVDEQT